MKIHLASVVVVSMSVLACSPTPTAPDGGAVVSLTECVEPRPEVCTMDYTPVCGQTRDGAQKLYSNGCGACSDASVVAYRPGLCEGSE